MYYGRGKRLKLNLLLIIESPKEDALIIPMGAFSFGSDLVKGRLNACFLYCLPHGNSLRCSCGGKGPGKMFENSEHQEGAGQFYGSMKWKKCRRSYLSLHPICERCNKLGIIRSAEIVHHKIYLNTELYKNPEVALSFDNLESLCFDCHQAEHYGKKECRDELYFDADGNLRKG